MLEWRTAEIRRASWLVIEGGLTLTMQPGVVSGANSSANRISNETPAICRPVSGQLQTGSTTEPAAVDCAGPALEQSRHPAGGDQQAARYGGSDRAGGVGRAVEPIKVDPHRPVERRRWHRGGG
jgi:hypothetical protein